LVEPYKEGLIKEWGIKKFNLDDLYVRFFRIAERRIAEKTGKGIVSFISNFSYLGDPSFVVMRQRFLQEFDSLWFDCLNGDSRETGKLTPEGKPDPSVFSTEYNREGIRVSWHGDPAITNEEMAKTRIMAKYARYNGLKDRSAIQKKMSFSAKFIRRFCFKPFDLRFCYADAQRPLWSEPSTSLSAQTWKGNAFIISRLVGVKSPEGSPFLFSTSEFERDVISGHARAFPIRLRAVSQSELKKKDDGNGEMASILHEAAPAYHADKTSANLSPAARAYLDKLGIQNPDDDADAAALIWMHTLAIGYAPAYLAENADGIRQDWPRIPLPDSNEALLASAELGRQVAALLDTENGVDGVTEGKVRPELVKIAVVTRLTLEPLNLSLTAGWGHAGQNGVTMPGKGRLQTRNYTAEESAAVAAVYDHRGDGGAPGDAAAIFGQSTHDIYLNDTACWSNVPEEVWDYTIGGYQVMKKWLSYREFALLGRALTPDEAREVTQMARRIAALLLLQPELDANYQRVKSNTYDWKA
jgi:hypothetical protein